MSTKLNLSGQTFGRWTVLSEENSINRKSQWLCRCSCGAERILCGTSLTSGNSKSCGCLAHEATSIMHRTHHGTVKHKAEYKIWIGMRNRCYNQNNKSYERYGGRGITVCSEWDSFEQFYKDMGAKPYPNASIDRKDNSKGYFPDNCRWATPKEQSNNRRNNTIYTYKGIEYTISELSKLAGLSKSTIRYRLVSGYSIEDAVELPLLPGVKYKLIANDTVRRQ